MSKKRKAIVKLSGKVRSLLDFKDEKDAKDFRKGMADDLEDKTTNKMSDDIDDITGPSMLSKPSKDPNEMDDDEFKDYLEGRNITEEEYYDEIGFNPYDESGVSVSDVDTDAFFTFDPEDAGRFWENAGNADNLIEYMETKLNTPKDLRDFMKGVENEVVDYGGDLKPYEDSENERIAAVAKRRLEEMTQLKSTDRDSKREGSMVKGFTREDLTPELLSLLDKQEIKGFESKEPTNDIEAIEESIQKFMEANDRSEMFPARESRENFRIGGLLRTVVKKLKPEEAEEVSTKADDIHNVIEESIDAGAKKKDVFNAISDATGLKNSEIAAIERIYAREAGGGQAVNLAEDLKMTYRALTNPRTALQDVGANIGGPGTKTRATREAQGKYGLAGIGIGSLLTGGATLTGAALYNMYMDDDNPTQKELTDFEKAFSKAQKAGEEEFTFKGKKYKVAIASEMPGVTYTRNTKAMGSLLSYD